MLSLSPAPRLFTLAAGEVFYLCRGQFLCDGYKWHSWQVALRVNGSIYHTDQAIPVLAHREPSVQDAERLLELLRCEPDTFGCP